MAAEKRAKPESLDFLLAAIAPLFIIGMIGSLVFFLITVFYQGGQTERLMWILGLYTLASVLIARIAIEQSRQIAFAYMFALAAATLIVTPQLFVVKGAMAVFSFPILILLLGTVAFLADRITLDCTSMNEQQQSTGVGLLQSLGLVKSERKLASEPKTGTDEIDVTPKEIQKRSSTKRKHDPGVWVLYFALLALPLFGLGQLAISSPIDRRWAFTYLFFYLLNSLFLLVLISLLSLRKYLRERGVPMETSFAIRWMAIGMTSVFAILLVLSLLPIPGQSILSMDLPFRIASRDDLKANQWGWGREGVEGEGPEQGKGEAQNKPAANQDGKGPDEGGAQGDKNTEGEQRGNSGKDNEKDNAKGESKGSTKGDSKGNTKGDAKEGNPPNEPRKQNDEKGSEPAEKQRENDKQEKSESGDSKPKEKTDPNTARKPNDPKRNKPADAQQPPGNTEEKRDDKQNAQQKQQQQRQQEKQHQERQQPPDQAEPQPPQPPQSNFSIRWDLAAIVQWLMMIALAIVALVYGILYRRELLAAFKSFLDWIRMLLGGKKKSPPPKVHVVEEATMLEDLYPPFHTFANPFRKGSGLSREQMVRHMYRAILSWGYEHRVVRRDDETPEEFMRRLFRRFPEQQESFSTLGMLYNRIAYAQGKVTAAEMQPLAEFWKWLEEKTVQGVA